MVEEKKYKRSEMGLFLCACVYGPQLPCLLCIAYFTEISTKVTLPIKFL